MSIVNNHISVLLLVAIFWVAFSGLPVWVSFLPKTPAAHADSTTYTISDGSLTAALVSGGCDTSQTNSTPSDGGQGTVISSACVGRNDVPVVKWTKTVSWETMGVPAGATVTQVDGSFKYRQVAESHNATQVMGTMTLRDSSDSAACAASDLEASFDPGPNNASFTTRNSSGAINVSTGCETAATSVTIRLDMTPRTGNNASATSELRADDVSLSITYFNPIFDQSAYRFFANQNSADVGSALDSQDTNVTLGGTGDQFRLRIAVHVSTTSLGVNGQSFKLQYVDKGGGSCASPSGGTPSSYTDVTTSTLISYYNNSTPADGDALTDNTNDPVHSGHTNINQTYEEANNFTNSQAVIASGEDGLWDFALYDNGAAASTAYCFRIVTSGGTALNSYVYPQVTTAAAGSLGVDIVDSGGSPVASPSVTFATALSSDTCLSSTGTLGVSSEKIRITNNTGSPAWSLSAAATSGATSNWSNGTETYDFNDPTSSGCSDGGDADSLSGQLSVDPSTGTVTPEGGCTTTGISLGSSSAFNQGTTDSITLASASSGADTGCYWDITDIDLSQTIPAFQPTGAYTINITLTAVAS